MTYLTRPTIYSQTPASTSQLVLPSSYLRSSQNATASQNTSINTSNQSLRPTNHSSPYGLSGASTSTLALAPLGSGPSSTSLYPTSSSGIGTRGGYAAGLLSPPSIMPGGQALPPRIQGQGDPTQTSFQHQHARKKSAERVGVGGSRRDERTPRTSNNNLQQLTSSGGGAVANFSTVSLGHLGQIMEADPVEEESSAPGRRRRRIVRGDTGLRRRLTVSSREEGAAVGLARGASMRRLNVWDGRFMTMCRTALGEYS